MSEDMIDVVTFTDDENGEFELELVDEFEYKGQKYVVLADLPDDDEDDECESCACDHDESGDGEDGCACGCQDGEDDEDDTLFIMKVVEKDGEEEYIPVEDEMMDEVIAVVESRLYSE